MEPHLAVNDKKMFYKYLNKAKVYFEYGSGGSTYQASIRNNINKMYSVESDITWQRRLKRIIKKREIVYIFSYMDTKPNTWGNPGKNATDIQKKNYSEHIKTLSPEEKKGIDLIFIDGRFRVACCLKCFDVINDDCFIAFDDFLNRDHYHVVLNYFDIIEKTRDERMVILKKKSNTSIPDEVIKKYEMDAR